MPGMSKPLTGQQFERVSNLLNTIPGITITNNSGRRTIYFEYKDNNFAIVGDYKTIRFPKIKRQKHIPNVQSFMYSRDFKDLKDRLLSFINLKFSDNSRIVINEKSPVKATASTETKQFSYQERAIPTSQEFKTLKEAANKLGFNKFDPRSWEFEGEYKGRNVIIEYAPENIRSTNGKCHIDRAAVELYPLISFQVILSNKSADAVKKEIVDKFEEALEKEEPSKVKSYAYMGQVITASSRKEAIQKIIQAGL